MAGGTTFHFVTDGIRAALERAMAAAAGSTCGSAAASQRSGSIIGAGLVDELHLAISPVLLGSGEHLFTGLDLPRLGYQRTEHVATPNATHVVLARKR